MAKSAKIKTRKPISTVTLLAWGLLALATAFDHIPSFRAAALILYAVDWLALAIAATLTKRKQTLIIRPGMILPLFISTLLLFQRKIRMTMQPAATIWLVTACFMLLTLPMLLAAEKQVPDERADDEKYWGRAVLHMGNHSIPLKKQQESRKSLALLGEMAYNNLACDSHRAE